MPTIEQIVEAIASSQSDEMDEPEFMDVLRHQFGMSEDEAQDLRSTLEDRGLLQVNGTGRMNVVIRYNPEAKYDALEAAAEAIDEGPARPGHDDPDLPGARSTLASEGLAGSLGGGPSDTANLAGRTPPGAPEESLEHLRDTSLHGRIEDMDSRGEYIAADPSADYGLIDHVHIGQDRYRDDEELLLGTTRTFEGEEVAPQSTRPDEVPYESVDAGSRAVTEDEVIREGLAGDGSEAGG